MKKLSTLVLMLLCGLVGFAKTDNSTFYVIRNADLSRPGTDSIVNTLYDHEFCDTLGNFRSGTTFKIKRCAISLTLFSNPHLAQPPTMAYDAEVQCNIQFKNRFSNALQPAQQVKLSIHYDPAKGVAYKAKDFFMLENAVWARIKVTKVNVPILGLDTAFYLQLQYEGEKVFTPVASQSPASISFQPSSNNGYLKATWEPLEWAERYELEWTFVDDYDISGNKPASSLSYDFRFNASRVSLLNTEYEIPMVFESGYVICRVRAIGIKGSNFDEIVNGWWNFPESASGIPSDATHVYRVSGSAVHQQDNMNWQYTGSFGGDELHKEAVKYMDGTLRSRQTVSTAHTDQNLIVSETYYDYQGRPGVKTLPAPVKPVAPSTGSTSITLGGGSGNPFQPGYHLLNLPGYHGTLNISLVTDLFSYRSTQPKIAYQKNFNLNPSGQPYSKADFDVDRGSSCDAAALPMSTSSGVGKYYSAENNEQDEQQAYVPDAQGYPFTQATYTPDKTGRIAIVANAGEVLKMGNGHNQHYYYGTPAQKELDRLFGSDAGTANQYTKEMLIDENNQAHITYKDLKGRVVATGLSGDAPAALAPIPHGDAVAINLHLLEEDNRIDEANQSILSNKTLLISKTTAVSFTYALTPPAYSTRYCDGTNVCYDCVYDLEIDVKDECGALLWHVAQPIGSLAALTSCSSTPVNLSQSVTLNAGNYYISKKLTISENAINSYLADYRNRICVQPVEPFLPAAGLANGADPCNAGCNTCPTVTINQSYTVTQRDGSTRTVSYPISKLGSNSGNCTLLCGQEVTSPCKTALLAMLSDVSPGGQYAEFRDTTVRDAINPSGITNPAIFQLSVLNEANQLPVRNANWRNPGFAYQNKNGTEAYIELNEDDLPAHMEVDIIDRDGKRFVKPQYLNRVEDFISYWQPQWANSLVMYHPEYGYYAWCINHSSTYSYDSLMRVTDTYSRAQTHNLINHRSLNCSNDPFFTAEPAARVPMMNMLEHFTSLSGYPDFNIEEATYLTVNCNNVNYNTSQLNSCARGKNLYTLPETADAEWKFYRDFYIMKRNLAHDEARKLWISANGYYLNNNIGTDSRGYIADPLYGDKVKRFNNSVDAFETLPVDAGDLTAETLYEWRSAADNNAAAYCNRCPIANDFTAFLNALASAKKLKANLTLPSITPLTFSKAITRSFADSLSIQYLWNNTATTNALNISISTSRGNQCTITLNKTVGLSWDSIARFDCFKAIDPHKFTLRATTAGDSTFEVSGEASCFNFKDCAPANVCTGTTNADEMAVLMKFLLLRNRYQSPVLILHRRGTNSPWFGRSLRSKYPGATAFVWKFKGWNITGKSFNAEITITTPGAANKADKVQNCNFTLSVITSGYTLADIKDIIDIRRADTIKGCAQTEFILTAVTSTGAQFFIHGKSCYELYNCCPVQRQPGNDVLCCIPNIRRPLIQRSCLDDARNLAETNRNRSDYYRTAFTVDTLRASYINHCLHAAEALNASYSESIYQITLYYYDRSGQLVKTIPPKGVDLLSDAEVNQVQSHRNGTYAAVYPTHTQATTYKYNAGNQCIQKASPDEGTVRYCYDQFGRLVMSQSASQGDENACTYLKYDIHGRNIETGRMPYSGNIPSAIIYSSFTSTLASASKTEITETVYDQIPSEATGEFSSATAIMRNRTAAIHYSESEGVKDYSTYFSCDAQGHVREQVINYKKLRRLFPALTARAEVKKIEFQYNNITGKVTRMYYQPKQADRFIHWYTYDADGRMVALHTGTNPYEMESLRDCDALYKFYQHGPLARIELGTEKIQGLDYAYTLNGWLKGINGGTTGGDNDMGADGNEGSHGTFARDIFGEVLNYFPDDYQSIAGSGASRFYPDLSSSELAGDFSKPLYNGFIQNSVSVINFDSLLPMNRSIGRAYRYDQANRFTEMKMLFNPGVNTALIADYNTRVEYDANSNISRMVRLMQSGSAMDDLTYHYMSDGSNRIEFVSDVASASAATTDIDNQSAGNYRYDASGKLTRDVAGGITNITWNNNATIKQLQKGSATVNYSYDAYGHRALKQSGSSTTFYIKDLKGNTLGTYLVTADNKVVCRSLGIYAETHLGEFAVNKVLGPVAVSRDSFYRGLKQYEIKNHIGDVQVVVTDKKIPSLLGTGVTSSADALCASDYYPFGMLMPGRSFGNRQYRFGWQGMESDDDFYGDDNEYTTQYRQYDARLGRWMSTDPRADKYPGLSPYVAMLNNPISTNDVLGDDPPEQTLAEWCAERGLDPRRMYEVLRFDERGNLYVLAVRPGQRISGRSIAGYHDRRGIVGWVDRRLSGTAWMEPYIENERLLEGYRQEVQSRLGDYLDAIGSITSEISDAEDVELGSEHLGEFCEAINTINDVRAALDAPDQVAAFIDAYESVSALEREVHDNPESGARLMAARARAFDRLLTSGADLLQAVGIELPPHVAAALEDGNLVENLSRAFFRHVYEMEEPGELHDALAGERMEHRGLDGVRGSGSTGTTRRRR